MLFLSLQFAYEAGISMRASFIFLSLFFIMCIISTFWFHPCGRIPYPLPPNYKFNLKCNIPCLKPAQDQQTVGPKKSKDESHDGDAHKELMNGKELDVEVLTDNSQLPLTNPDLYEEETPSFSEIVRTPLFVWDVVWLTCHRFASWSFVGRLNPALERLAGGDKSIGKTTNKAH